MKRSLLLTLTLATLAAGARAEGPDPMRNRPTPGRRFGTAQPANNWWPVNFTLRGEDRRLWVHSTDIERGLSRESMPLYEIFGCRSGVCSSRPTDHRLSWAFRLWGWDGDYFLHENGAVGSRIAATLDTHRAILTPVDGQVTVNEAAAEAPPAEVVADADAATDEAELRVDAILEDAGDAMPASEDGTSTLDNADAVVEDAGSTVVDPAVADAGISDQMGGEGAPAGESGELRDAVAGPLTLAGGAHPGPLSAEMPAAPAEAEARRQPEGRRTNWLVPGGAAVAGAAIGWALIGTPLGAALAGLALGAAVFGALRLFVGRSGS